MAGRTLRSNGGEPLTNTGTTGLFQYVVWRLQPIIKSPVAAIQLPITRTTIRAQNALIDNTIPPTSVAINSNGTSVAVSSSQAEGVRASIDPVRKP